MLDLNNFVGKTAIIRGNNSGVQFGKIEEIEGTTVILSGSRRLWYWSGAASLSQLAEQGVKNPKGCKFSIVTSTPHIITDTIEILICTEEAITNINEVPEWLI